MPLNRGPESRGRQPLFERCADGKLIVHGRRILATLIGCEVVILVITVVLAGAWVSVALVGAAAISFTQLVIEMRARPKDQVPDNDVGWRT